jgi:Fic family protein
LLVSDPDVHDARPWPALAYETWQWQSEQSAPASRIARRRHRGPYLAAVVPEIATRPVALPPETAALVDDAATEVARFDAELGHEIAPFAAVLLRSESAASSKIENLTASARAIAEAQLHLLGGRNASLIVANERAMSAAIELADRIDADAILAMHTALLEWSAPDIAGRWRDEQVWIGGGDLGPHGALFVPPHHTRVPAAIADLVSFIEREDIAVLAHAAVAHAQFETIHPFPDGNGRTGRALVHALLRNKRLTRNVTVPVSAGLLTDTDAYFAALTRFRDGDPVPIVEQFAKAAFAAIANGRLLVDDLHTIRHSWDERVRARRNATAWRVADLLLRHPVVNAALIASELGIASQNTYRSFGPLLDAGVLVEFTDKKRNQLWRAPEVLDSLDRFAARAGWRNRASR